MKKLTKNWHIFVFVTFSLTPVLWFLGKGNVLVNGIDTNFPLDPLIWFKRRLYVWNSIPNAGIDFSSSTAGIFFHLVQAIPHVLGFDLQGVQLISFIFWFSLIVLSSYTFSRVVFPKRRMIQLLFITIYVYNVYIFNTWENVKVANLSLVAAIPLGLTSLILLNGKKTSRAKVFLLVLLTGVVASGAGINPSYFISFFITLIIFAFSVVLSNLNKHVVIENTKNFLLILAGMVLINLFWILPTANFILNNVSPQGSIDNIGFTNWIDSLSENTSLFNVLRLQGAWDWYAFDGATNLPLYIPYVVNYFYNLPFIVFSLLIPGLAFVSLVFRDDKKNDFYLSFALMMVIGVFLGSGTHPPSGSVYFWMSEHIPFFTLFRSPWYIFTPMVVLAYAGLPSLLFLFLLDKVKKYRFKLGNPAVHTTILVIVVGNMLYSYPLISGKIFRPGRPDSFYIEFPEYVFDSYKWLNKLEKGRVIGYPDDEIQNFDWGYRGIESVIALGSEKEVLFSPISDSSSQIAKVIKKYYLSLKKDQAQSAFNLASKLNVNLILEKRDQKSLANKLPSSVTTLPVTNLGKWSFYNLSDLNFLPKIYPAKNLFFGYPMGQGEEIMTLFSRESHLLNPEDEIIAGITELNLIAGKAVLAENLQLKAFNNFIYSKSKLSDRLTTRDLSKVEFTYSIPEDGLYTPVLERYLLDEFGLEGDIGVRLDGVNQRWVKKRETDSYVYFQEVYFYEGEHEVEIALSNNNLINSGEFDSEMEFEKGGSGDDGSGEYLIVSENENKYLSIINKGTSDVTADILVPNFDPLVPYYVELQYKQIYGNNSRVTVGQDTPTTLIKAQVERLPNYPEWNSFSFFYDPVKTDSSMRVFLSAPYVKDPLGTKVFYDNLVVKRVFTNNLFFVKDVLRPFSLPEVSFEKNSQVKYTGRVNSASTSHVLIFSENYSPGWELKVMDRSGKELAVKPIHFSINKYANAWYIKDPPSDYSFEIFYGPQRLFILGAYVSLGVIIFFVLYSVKSARLHEEHK